jgi:ABC-type amino acid transport substrate-binding protein
MVCLAVGDNYSQEVLQNKKIKFFGAISDHIQLNILVNGRIKYALVYTMPGTLIANNDPKLKGKVKIVGRINDDAFWVVFSKNHTDGKRLRDTFQSGLEQFKASGEYDKMMKEFSHHYVMH